MHSQLCSILLGLGQPTSHMFPAIKIDWFHGTYGTCANGANKQTNNTTEYY